MATDSITSSSSNKPVLQQPKENNDILGNVKVDDFLKLMIAELQNQDPLNPMDNAQLLNQLGQMQSINASTKLTTTLDSVLLGQNLSSASGLLGKTIAGLDDAGKNITGAVDSVFIEKGNAKAVVGNSIVSLKNIGQILPN
jgi:flagellar basal-body rod modification protein FlgD